ncbi:PQQ-binding-like beta-propeller repeat protein [Tuwongella immobilis]|uniref:Pyrrolo-quinoline quinone repeat domain-containing protein n=1 Tax=Tuwongella immobilis TaxID=692036 RepID=A0A6C2YUE9_9BACT|nr:PQQ-binding-like beta-propeller repeat protein [Tuwongella immobilis]VIP05064.1 FOG: WD40 repeat-like protein OS=Pirellula staleyi (strain ATCC 27377 / DSM 6068 / ICPB 4128) GN=Psta_1741 PE=4 SV=1: PQQ_3: PQQ_2 [Tuwongella immobilis]VTS07484.1 FOG: WD40 repeat-like protein OS=Pirellula staleyi (strain ATCC 27377 / DSM 6068 / ICPB 4128) GN=Psta_1741 PE=4 SV=1: PQQ_3: PQQ_2 [Tuwongella immobilis]
MQTWRSRLGCSMLGLLMLAPMVRADDWPQWMGPNRDGGWKETGILDRFPSGGPVVKWRTEVGYGYSGPAVAGDTVFVTDYVNAAGKITNDFGKRDRLKGKERVLAFDRRDGKLLWTHEYPIEYDISYPSGPRATPTIHGGKVYTQGAEGNLICLDAASGKLLWQHDLKKKYRTEAPMWGFSTHPLVDGQKLITLVGGKDSLVVAFDKDTGAEIWKSLNGKEPGYSSPVIVNAGGTRQLLIFHAEAIASLDPESGKAHWSVPFKPMYGMSILTPQVSNDLLFVGGIVSKGIMLKLAKDRPAAEVLWKGERDTALYPKTSSPLVDNGYLYGVDMDGELRCVNMETGERLWETNEPTTGGKKANSGTAFLVRNGDRLFLFGENGVLTIAKLSTKGYEPIDSAKIIEPTNPVFGRMVVWTHPAFAHKCVFVRNDRELICVSLEK